MDCSRLRSVNAMLASMDETPAQHGERCVVRCRTAGNLCIVQQTPGVSIPVNGVPARCDEYERNQRVNDDPSSSDDNEAPSNVYAADEPDRVFGRQPQALEYKDRKEAPSHIPPAHKAAHANSQIPRRSSLRLPHIRQRWSLA